MYKRLYKIWSGLKQRCLNSNDKDYKNYGERGIQVCNEWIDDFLCFKDWAINNGYSEQLTIDRVDVNGNYDPNNCRWVNYTIQARNKRVQRNNKSGYPGIFKDSHGKKWRVVIYVDNKRKHIGVFEDLNDAIEARKQAENTFWNLTA